MQDGATTQLRNGQITCGVELGLLLVGVRKAYLRDRERGQMWGFTSKQDQPRSKPYAYCIIAPGSSTQTHPAPS